MRPHHWPAPLLALALLLTAGPAPSSASPPPPRAPASVSTDGHTTRLTLITGDRVLVTAHAGRPDQVTFEPGSTSTSATTTQSNGHTIVIPSAAKADLLSGRLDPALFDVTTLIAERRDDAASATLPVIVRYAGSTATARSRAKQAAIPGAAKTRVLTSIGARAVAVRKNSTAAFWKSVAPGRSARVAGTIQRISLDRRIKVALDQSVPQIGAPAAWQRGLTGRGVKIAVLDTGLDTNEDMHPDLAGRIAESANFSDAADTLDRYGHGTHVASIAAGNGAASGGKYKGVAPEATILNGKVLDDYGQGSESGVIGGMEWAAARGAAVANLSLGSGPSDGTDEVSLAANRLSQETGMLFVVAAGNCLGEGPGSVSSPGAADAALAVGNLERDGSLNETSCRGPRKNDGALKPEISAPGTDIVAARSTGTNLGQPVDDRYTTLTGTSMATPHVAGAAALLAQAHPDWRATQLRNRLISTADPQAGSRVDEQGAGRVDADQATDSEGAEAVTVETAELELGKLAWPYPATDPVTRELTYHNPGSTAVTLQLAVSFEPARAAPKLSASQLVVPAGGDASVTVTADRAAAGTGAFSGRITATPPGADPLVTTIGWYAEQEMHTLTVRGINRDGSPAEDFVGVQRLDGEPLAIDPFDLVMRNGVLTLRVPPGRYEASTALFAASTDEQPGSVTMVVSPEVQVKHQDATATLDARRGAPVNFAVRGRSDLSRVFGQLTLTRRGEGDAFPSGTSVALIGASGSLFATPTKFHTGTGEFVADSRLELPPYRLQALGADQPVYDFFGGPRFTGTKNLEVYDAGTAQPAELTGVAGKLAMIRFTGDRLNGDLVEAARAAGAAAAVLYNPATDGPGGVDGFYRISGTSENDGDYPAMRVPRTVAQELLTRSKIKPVRVKLTGVAFSPVAYSLLVPWAGRIPARADVTAGPGQLARVDETFGAHVDALPSGTGRSGTTPSGMTTTNMFLSSFKAPGRQTSYVQANGTAWESSVWQGRGDGGLYETRSTARTYRPGERSRQSWTRPIATSGLPNLPSNQSQVRQEDGLLKVVLSPFAHGPEQRSDPWGFFETSNLTVDRDGRQIATGDEGSSGTEFDNPVGPADYRVSLDTRRETESWLYSTRVRSTWEFRSTGGADEFMPLVLADLDVPQSDDLNRVKVGKPVDITVALRHQAGSSKSAFTAPKVEISYDGSTWTALPVRRIGTGRYAAKVTHPANQAGKSPSVRLTAADAAGNKLAQEVTRAYGLR